MRTHRTALMAGASLAILTLVAGPQVLADTPTKGPPSAKSSPLDTNIYKRPATPGDQDVNAGNNTGESKGQYNRPIGAQGLQIDVVDVLLKNTSATLGTGPSSETGIAVNPKNPNEIVITAFEFNVSWAQDSASVFYSADGGKTWSEPRPINRPPGESATGLDSCPCDQTLDFSKTRLLTGAFLTADDEIFTASTSHPVKGPFAYDGPTNPVRGADQPWMLVNTSPQSPVLLASVELVDDPVELLKKESSERVYTAYDDFSGIDNNTSTTVGMLVAAAEESADPLAFTVHQSGVSFGAINPGHRLAKDQKTGAMYSLFQQSPGNGAGDSVRINYFLNRSTDGGQTWTLNGSANGIVVASADSNQSPGPAGNFKFCTVNALLGGVDHATVAPDGSLYYVYGTRTNRDNRIAIRHLTDNKSGGLTIGPEHLVTTQTAVQAAIPQVAVNKDGTVGVFYYTCDTPAGAEGFPQFSAHFALSDDEGKTFVDHILQTFLSPAKDNGDARQRVLGDYMQTKTLPNKAEFFGSFSGNGAAAGGKTSEIDPFFFKVSKK